MSVRWRLHIRSCLLLALLAAATGAQAETVYVTDKLLADLHAQKELDSPIIRVLPTGTELELLQRDGDLAQVRDRDKTVGWIESDYLMATIPAQREVAALRAEIESVRKRLQESKPAGKDSGLAELIEQLTRENADLQGLITTERLRVSALEQHAVDLRQPGTAPQGPHAAADERSQIPAGPTGDSTKDPALTNTGIEIRRPTVTLVIAGGLTLILLGLAGGAFLMDWLQRRRHGGFRI
jgi:hypothetical protein